MSELLPPLILEIRARAGEAIAGVKEVGGEVDKMAAKSDAGMSRSQAAFKKTAGVGKVAALGIAGGVLAIGVASLKMGTDYQEATTQLVTGAGESEENIAKVRKGLLNMAPAVGMGPEALAKAMFLVESAGYHGAEGLTVMKAAAEGAKIGGAEATVVANGLTTAMTDYKIPASQAADVTSKLIATVASGKTTMGDLAGSLSAVLPAAAAAHVGLNQVLGAMGTMTGQGISAQQAAQNIAGTIRSLSNPSAVASHEMAQMGLNSTVVAQQLGKRGLTGTLTELTEAITKHMGPSGLVLQSSFNQSQLAAQSANTMLKQLPPSLQGLARGFLAGTVTQKQWMAGLKDQPALAGSLGRQFATAAKRAHGFSDMLKSGGGAAQTYNAALSNMTGGATGLNTALALSGANAKTFAGNVDTIGKASTEAGGHVKGWTETQKDLGTQIAQAKAGIEAMGTKLGIMLIPWVEKAITVGTRWANYLTQHKALLYTVAGVVGGVLVLAIGAYTISMISAAVATIAATWPILAVIAAVGLLIVGAVLLAKHWHTVWGDIKGVAVSAWHWAEDIFHNKITQTILALVAPPLFVALHWRRIWGDIQNDALAAWHFLDNDVIHPIEGGFHDMVRWISGVPGDLDRIYAGMFDGLISAGKDAFNWVARAWNDTVGQLSFRIPSWVPKVGGDGFSMPQIPTFANGGQLNLHGWNLVGERGAELVGPGGKVMSNRDSSKFLGGLARTPGGAPSAGAGGGPQVLHATIYVTMDGQVIASSMETQQLRTGARRGVAYQQNPKA